MKKILILGGTYNQIPLIESAKKCGYYVVLCDYTTTNPGIALSDRHYQVNTLDKNACLNVAIKEKVQGVISNSEPAMLTVAYIAETLNLIGNSFKSIEMLSTKDKFRKFQSEIGLFSPQSIAVDNETAVENAIENLKFPIMIKPSESSASRGTTKVDNKTDKELIYKAFRECKAYSRNGNVTIEEFIEMPANSVIEGDIFVFEDTIIWDGLFLTQRGVKKPLVPMSYCIPLALDKDRYVELKTQIKKLFLNAKIVHGEYNVEMYFTSQNELFVIEVNVRQGGRQLPLFIQQHCGIDMYRLLVTTAMGDKEYLNTLIDGDELECNRLIKHSVFGYRNGLYLGIHIDDSIQKFVVQVQEMKEKNEYIDVFKEDEAFIIGEVLLRFEDANQQMKILNEIEEYVYPIIE